MARRPEQERTPEEVGVSEHAEERQRKVVYLLVETGSGDSKKTLWKNVGIGSVNRDGSINLKLDLFPGLTFNVRDPKPDADIPFQEQT